MEAAIVALIGVVGSILVVLVEKGRKENTRDHAVVANKLETITYVLENIDEDVAHIEAKIDNHLDDHVKASFGGFDIDDKEDAPRKNKKKKNGKKR